MDNRMLLRIGITGSVVAALCCATPILVILLSVLGLSAWVGWLDYVVIPALVVFIGITIYALRSREEAACCPAPDQLQAKNGKIK